MYIHVQECFYFQKLTHLQSLMGTYNFQMKMIQSSKNKIGWTVLFFIIFVQNCNLNLAQADSTEDAPFIYGTMNYPESFDPLGMDARAYGNIIVNCFEGLFQYDYTSDSGLSIIPCLAEDMGTWNAETGEFTVQIKSGIEWWDGTPVSAEDVVWNFNRIKALTQTQANLHFYCWGRFYYHNQGDFMLLDADTIDDFTVKITFDTQFYEWKHILAFWGASFIKPMKILESREIFPVEEFEKLIGTGPFQISNHTVEHTILTRNTNYRQGCPDISEIQVKYYSDPESLSNAFMRQELHVCETVTESDYHFIQQITSDLETAMLMTPPNLHLNLHVDKIPRDLRKAIQFGLNYSAVADQMEEKVHTHPIPERMEGYNPSLPGLPFYNLTMARNYLLTSNIPAIQNKITEHQLTDISSDEDWRIVAASSTPIANLTFSITSTDAFVFLAEQFQNIGVKLLLDFYTNQEFYAAYSNPTTKAKFEITASGWTPPFYDPVGIFDFLYTPDQMLNWNGLNNETITANIDALKEMEPWTPARAELIDTIVSQIIVEQAAAMYIVAAEYYPAWNTDPSFGILSGEETLINGRMDKYFYHLDFYPTEPTTPENDRTIPGFTNLYLPIFIGFILISLPFTKKRRLSSIQTNSQ